MPGSSAGMRVVVIGATGNHGSSLVRRLSRDPESRRSPASRAGCPKLALPKVSLDVGGHRQGRPRRRVRRRRRGRAPRVAHPARRATSSVTHAVERRGLARGSSRPPPAPASGTLVYASSVGAYSPGPEGPRASTSRGRRAASTRSFYSRHKAAVERILDSFEAAHPGRPRRAACAPAWCSSARRRRRSAACSSARSCPARSCGAMFVPGRARPRAAALPGRAHRGPRRGLPAGARAPRGARRVQHRRRAGARPAGARPTPSAPRGVPLHARPAARRARGVAYRLRLQPTEPGWLDMGLGVPLMDTSRAQRELGLGAAAHGGRGVRRSSSTGSARAPASRHPPLDPQTSGPLRIREVLTGIGQTSK